MRRRASAPEPNVLMTERMASRRLVAEPLDEPPPRVVASVRSSIGMWTPRSRATSIARS